MPGVRQGQQTPGDARQDHLGGVRRRTPEPCALCRPLRWIPCSSGIGVHDLFGQVRQEQILGRCPRRGAAGGDKSLCRPAGMLAGWSDCRSTRACLRTRQNHLRSPALHTCSGSQAPSRQHGLAMRLPGNGCPSQRDALQGRDLRSRSAGCSASWNASRAATGKWSTS